MRGRTRLSLVERLYKTIGQIKNAQEIARRKYVNGFYSGDSRLTNPAEVNLPLLEGRLQNVQDEKKRVRQEQDRAQRQEEERARRSKP